MAPVWCTLRRRCSPPAFICIFLTFYVLSAAPQPRVVQLSAPCLCDWLRLHLPRWLCRISQLCGCHLHVRCCNTPSLRLGSETAIPGWHRQMARRIFQEIKVGHQLELALWCFWGHSDRALSLAMQCSDFFAWRISSPRDTVLSASRPCYSKGTIIF